MKRIALALATTCVLVLGAAGVADAQDGSPVVEIDNPEPTAGDTVNVNITGAEPEAEFEIELGTATASGVIDADGNGTAEITIPDTPGELDGIVNINGVEVPISVLIAAAEGEGGAGAGDGGAGGGELAATGADVTTLTAIAVVLLLVGTAMSLLGRRTA